MPRMLKPRSLERNCRILKDVTRDFASIEDLAKELEKTSKHNQKKTKPLLHTYVRYDDCELSFV